MSKFLYIIVEFAQNMTAERNIRRNNVKNSSQEELIMSNQNNQNQQKQSQSEQQKQNQSEQNKR